MRYHKRLSGDVLRGLDHVSLAAKHAATQEITHQRRFEIEEALLWIDCQKNRVQKLKAKQNHLKPDSMEGA